MKGDVRMLPVDELNAGAFAGFFDSDILLMAAAREAVAMVMTVELENGQQRLAAGIAVRIEGDSANILWLYTIPEYRRQGFASTLLHHILDALLVDESILGVYMFYEGNEENEGLDGLLDANGFNVKAGEGSGLIEFTLADVTDIPILNKNKNGIITTLAKTNKRLLQEFVRDPDLIEGYLDPDTSAWADEYLPCSRIYIEYDRITGILLFSKAEDGISLDYAFVRPQFSKILAEMMQASLSELRKTYAPDTTVTLAAKNDATIRLVSKLVKNKKMTAVHIAEMDFGEYIEQFLASHTEEAE